MNCKERQLETCYNLKATVCIATHSTRVLKLNKYFCVGAYLIHLLRKIIEK